LSAAAVGTGPAARSSSPDLLVFRRNRLDRASRSKINHALTAAVAGASAEGPVDPAAAAGVPLVDPRQDSSRPDWIASPPPQPDNAAVNLRRHPCDALAAGGAPRRVIPALAAPDHPLRGGRLMLRL
jgi:hypothetical protein